jgi:TRAP-type C4-dicarboxylate transport system permease small subunit
VLFVAMTGIMVSSVTSRFLLTQLRIARVDQLLPDMFVWMSMLGAATAIRHRSHLGLLALIERLSPRWSIVTSLLTTSVGLAFFGVLASVQGAGSLAGGILAGTLVTRFGGIRVSAAGYLLMGTGMLLCVAQSLPLFLVGVALNGMGLPMLAVALGTAEQLYTPSRLQGRVAAPRGVGGGQAPWVSKAVGAGIVGRGANPVE